MSELEPSRLRKALEHQGYGVRTRISGWADCLVTGHGETWLGHGETADAALQDAVRRMLPSALGRRLLLASTPAASPSARVRPLPASAPATRAAAPKPVAATPTPAPVPSPVRAAQRPSPAPALVEAEPPAAEPPAAEPEERAPLPDVPLRPVAEINEALEELALLERRINDARPELALMSAELQRLHFLAWICRARAVQSRVDDELSVERAAGAIARLLGVLGKRWWPGSVKALQIRATPLDAGAEMGLADGGRLHDWLEAAERSEEILAARLDAVGESQLDDYGWADQGALTPAPTHAANMLAEIRAQLERVLGPLDREPGRDARDALRTVGATVSDRLVTAARGLRWLRGHVDDAEAWANVMGRLRWAASQLGRQHGGPLLEVLSAEHRPPMSWAQALGQDPKKKRQRKRRRQILDTMPNQAEPTSDEAMADWLSEAFDLGTELPNPRIAGLLFPVKEQVLALDMDALPDSNRRLRKRLADLKKRLQLIGPDEASAIRRDADREEDTAAPSAGDEATAAAPEVVVEAAPDPLAAITALVRRHTSGKRALFVSNREDPDLKSRLEGMLGLELDWSVIDPRRVQSRCESIQRGSYDFVLSATGFQGHSVDAALYRAARSAGVQYVRVNRGRPTTCVRSLARDLGVEAA